MSLSLGLILMIAAVLPGIIALFAFYANVSTAEIKVTPPPLGSILAISLVGLAALACHTTYILLLWVASHCIGATCLPSANPYAFFLYPKSGLSYQILGWSLLGMIYVSLIGFLVGLISASIRWSARDRMLFGWILPLIQQAQPKINFINAHILSKTQHGEDILGYEGAVQNLILDNEKRVTGLVLQDVETFYVRMETSGPTRIKGGTDIAKIVITSDDFQNLAFEVVRDERQLLK